MVWGLGVNQEPRVLDTQKAARVIAVSVYDYALMFY